jgi:flagellar M-ring protein FliF
MPGVAPALGETDQYGVPTGGPQIVPRGGVDETLDQMIELRSVEGKVRASSLLKLSQIVDDNPDEVVAILRSWIYEDAA